jgi:hypothetical protein
MSSIFFHPWVGSDYCKRGILAKRSLVLGESYYERYPDKPLRENFTNLIVKNQIEGHWRQRFYTKVTIAFLERSPSLEDKKAFWNSVVHYTYVQQPVGNGWWQRPAQDMWSRARAGFQEVLAEYRPEFILVTGKQLWDNISCLAHSCGPSIEGAELKQTRLYSTSGGNLALAYAMKHPASLGFRAMKWHPWIVKAMGLAECYP